METLRVGETEDLATLAKLDEKVLLEELKVRYSQDKIYTYVGDILVSVNPYRDLGIYGHNASEKYKFSKRSEHPPHIFAVADTAYQDMMGLRGRPARNQCILISGESGAGKTESTKLIINQLINVSKGNTHLDQQIIQVNPLLEAFGNAQTLMNDNSSRFGRFIQLRFSDGQVIGSKISEYLLEKSRVVQQNEGEENFHIFYYMFAGLTPDEQNKLKLKDPHRYRYFCDRASCLKSGAGKLKERYEELVNAMDMVGFTDQEQADMFTVLSGVLSMGNIDIEVNDDGQAVIPSGPGTMVRTVADLVGVDYQNLHAVLTSSRTVTKGDEIKRIYNQEQAKEARDAVAKALYGRLFSWIVNKVNTLLAPTGQDPGKHMEEIGILDIFGFEHFDHNSFEQACINLANEQLQFFFNKHVFTLEQEEYKKEGIDWNEIKFVDNQPLLDLFLGKPIGVLSLLDEECTVPRGSDLGYVGKMNMKFDHDRHYSKPKHSNTTVFTIHHYAGKVTYDADGWLEKNRDTLPPGVMQMLQVSTNELLSLIFKGKISRTGTLALKPRLTERKTKRMAQKAAQETKERKLTVGAQFRNSLHVLMERMTASQPVFIRCIKPNRQKKAHYFEEEFVDAQLLYTGMLETTKIRREGFAVRPSFLEFTEKYCFLAYKPKMDPTAENCKEILQTSKINGWQLGKTKVFLKYYHIDGLTERLECLGKQVIHIQKLARGFLGRRKAGRARKMAEQERQKMEALMKHIQDLQISFSDRQATMLANDAKIPESFFKPKEKINETKPKLEPKISTGSYMEPLPAKVNPATEADLESSDSDVSEDEFTPVKSGGAERFGKQGTKQASVRWFKETQKQVVTDPNKGRFADWFHGIITRRESERLLSNKACGSFLIRVSESRFGYTLSFQSEDRVRHYMVDQLPNGKFIVIGEPKVHRSLHDLILHHQRVKLSNWDHFLVQPCGQEMGMCDYADLVESMHYQDSLKENTPVYFEPDPNTLRPAQSTKSYGYCSAYDTPCYATEKNIRDASNPPPIPNRKWRPDLVKLSSQADSTLPRQPPPLPDRMYSLQKPLNQSHKQPTPSEEVYHKLLENQKAQHRQYQSSPQGTMGSVGKTRMSTSRQRLSKPSHQ